MQVYRPGDGPTTRHKGAGSLKTEELEGRYFRDRKIAAPLKQVEHEPIAVAFRQFPRSQDRGPIEASHLLLAASKRQRVKIPSEAKLDFTLKAPLTETLNH